VIRVWTLDSFDDKQLAKFNRTLYTAFGVGSEHSGSAEVPAGMPEPLDAEKLLQEVKGIRSYKDDKVLLLTTRKLKERELPSGVAPTSGFAWHGKDRAVLSIAPHKDLETGFKPVARHALHQLGHLWELHHCLDPRCSMYPPWTPSFAQGEPIFCTFCREKSEQKIRLAKS
jgi:predicted Zn-dependent protease